MLEFQIRSWDRKEVGEAAKMSSVLVRVGASDPHPVAVWTRSGFRPTGKTWSEFAERLPAGLSKFRNLLMSLTHSEEAGGSEPVLDLGFYLLPGTHGRASGISS